MRVLPGKKYMFLPAALMAAFVLAACGSKGSAGKSASPLNKDKLFTSRDMKQTADQSGAETIKVKDGDEISIKKEGVYVLMGTAKNASVTVNAKDGEVQLVLDSLSVTNKDIPVINVKKADKVLITMAQGSQNSLSVTGKFRDEKGSKGTAVINSKASITLNGSGRLKISSKDQGIASKEKLLITGGAYELETDKHALEAEDSVLIADGDIMIRTGNDGIYAGNEDDTSKGHIYMGGGKLNIKAGDDCMHTVAILQIDGGDLRLEGHECMEGTWILINGGTLYLSGEDDAINATRKAKDYYETRTEINGGSVKMVVPNAEADGIDCNGSLVITGGTVEIAGTSAIDVTEKIIFTGGTVIVNGESVKSLDQFNTAE